MTACILDPSRELGGHHNAQTIGVQITPDAPDIKGAGRLYKDEKAVKQWIFSSFTNVKFAMRTTEDQWSISNALGNVRVLSLCEEFSDSIKLDFGRLLWDIELIKLIFFGGFSLVFFHLSEAKLVQPVLIHERL
ncbi:hypothetical protein TB2_039753 [Malus domestica]